MTRLRRRCHFVCASEIFPASPQLSTSVSDQLVCCRESVRTSLLLLSLFVVFELSREVLVDLEVLDVELGTALVAI
jgi:hypothetical protein